MNDKYIRIGALFALSAVALGAFGAHGLKASLSENGTTAVWETAVRYQMWHALALIIMGGLSLQYTISRRIAPIFTVGTILFSGSLYGLALGGPKLLGPITPIGGLLFIIGWLLFAFSLKKG